MKKRYVPIITLSLAILLVGSIAYASDKRKKVKSVIHECEMSEEALKAELLDISEEQLKKQPVTKVDNLIKNSDVDLAELIIK